MVAPEFPSTVSFVHKGDTYLFVLIKRSEISRVVNDKQKIQEISHHSIK